MSGSPLRWPTKQVCIKCPFTQDLSSSPTSLYIYIYIYIYIYNYFSQASVATVNLHKKIHVITNEDNH